MSKLFEFLCIWLGALVSLAAATTAPSKAPSISSHAPTKHRPSPSPTARATAATNSSSASLPSAEVKALQDLFASADGPRWTDITNRWTFALDSHGGFVSNPCSPQWTGVMCASPSGPVVALELSLSSLDGTLSTSLGSLSALVYIDLSSNYLEGPIPSSLWILRSLRFLSLGDNSLTGSLAPEIGRLKKLIHLDLSYNLLSGSIDSSIGSLTALTFLSLWNNVLSGSIPSGLGRWLTNMVDLNLSSNKLTGTMSTSIGGMTALKSLCISENNLIGTIFEGLGRKLTNLVYLDLYSNQLTGSLPTSVGGMTALTRLSIFDNHFRGQLPSTLWRLTDMVDLVLFSNHLTGTVSSSIGGMKALTRLRMYDNRLRGRLPSELGNLTNLAGLRINSNAFSGPLPRQIGHLTALLYLEAQNNRFNESLPSEIGQLRSLHTLKLANNTLSGRLPRELGRCLNLSSLQLQYNRFSGELGSSLCDITAVQGAAVHWYTTSNNFTCYADCLGASTGLLNLGVPSCSGEGKSDEGYVSVAFYSDALCSESALTAETVNLAGVCLPSKHGKGSYKLHWNATAGTTRLSTYKDAGCNVVPAHSPKTPRLTPDRCYPLRKSLYTLANTVCPSGQTDCTYLIDIKGQESEGVGSVAFLSSEQRRLIQSQQELLDLFRLQGGAFQSVMVRVVPFSQADYSSTRLDSTSSVLSLTLGAGPGRSSSSSVSLFRASPSLKRRGFLVKNIFAANITQCLSLAAPSQSLVVTSDRCFPFTEKSHSGNRERSKIYYCREGVVQFRVFNSSRCCVGEADSGCLASAVVGSYDDVCAEASPGFSNQEQDDDAYLHKAGSSKHTVTQFHNSGTGSFTITSTYDDTISTDDGGKLVRWNDHNASADSRWSCVPPLPRPPAAGLATVTTFSGSLCTPQATLCELSVELGLCVKNGTNLVRSSGSWYREHYVEPGAWGVLSYDILRSEYATPNCAGPAVSNVTTATRLKDTCIAEDGSNVSYRFEFHGSATSGGSYQYQQMERDGTSEVCVTAPGYAPAATKANLTRQGSHRGACRNVVNGTSAAGEALADRSRQVFAVKTLYSDAYCSSNSVVTEEAYLVGDDSCYPLSDTGGSYKLYVSKCGGQLVPVAASQSPDIISLRYSTADCSGKAAGYDSSLTGGPSSCFVSASPAGSYTVSVTADLPAPRLSGYVEMVYPSLQACLNRASSPAKMRRAYSPSQCVQQTDGTRSSFTCHSALSFHLDRVSAAVALSGACGGERGQQQKTHLSSASLMGFVSSAPASDCYPSSKGGAVGHFFSLVSTGAGTSGQVSRLPSGYHSSVVCLASTSAVFQQELQDQRNQWAIQVNVAVVSLCASLLMLAVIVRMNKYTDAIVVILALTCCQVCYDASFILPLQPANEPLSQTANDSVHRSLFLTHVFGLACILLTNYLAFTCLFIIFNQRSFPSRRFFPYVCTGIASVCIVLASLSAAATPPFNQTESAEKEQLFADALIALRGWQAGCIIINLMSVVAMYIRVLQVSAKDNSKRSWTSTSPASSEGKKISSALVEMCRRLLLYPVVLALTQFPVLWDTFAYELDARGHFPRSDDDFYTTEKYRAYAYVYALLAPSAGLLFAIVFFAFQPGPRTVIIQASTRVARYATGLSKKAQPLGRQPTNSRSPTTIQAREGESSTTPPDAPSQNMPAAPDDPLPEAPTVALHELEDDELEVLVIDECRRISQRIPANAIVELTSSSTVIEMSPSPARPLSAAGLGDIYRHSGDDAYLTHNPLNQSSNQTRQYSYSTRDAIPPRIRSDTGSSE